ncbi:MAG: right-handed parallel beta-helix repeat-containing protein, partial [Gemmataceae bacterium]|nr:right-handed parallel beta-helix repeat-containing protein [Gemmataceae bacterium]
MSAYPRRRVALRRARPLTLDRLEDRCTPAVFTVLNTSDAGPGSLRQAILDANALAGADSIVFDPVAFSSASTISLTTGTLTVTDSVSVIGPGAGLLTLDAKQKRGLTIDGPGTLAVTISGLTLTNGSTTGDGGGIFIANESVTLDHCTISHSTALGNGGGVWAGVGSNLVLTECDVVGSSAGARGGGLYSDCYTRFTDCSVLDNSAGKDGGGLFVRGATLALVTSTVARNSAGKDGGGMAMDFVVGSYLVSTTVSSNRAGQHGGGVFLKSPAGPPVYDDFAIAQCTIAENRAIVAGGGVWADIRNVRFTNSLTAKNVAGYDSDLYSIINQSITRSVFGELHAVGYNLGIGAIPPGADLKLGPLADNGGGRLTHALLPGSPCIDRGDLTLFSETDGRGAGFPRQSGLFPDVGAFEAATPTPVTPVARGQGYSAVDYSGGSTYEFRVDYSGAVDIELSSLDDSDIRVSGPGGFSTMAKFLGLQSSQYSVPRTARYQFTPPGGAWDTSDYGRYTFSVEPGQVRDVAGTYVAAGPVGFADALFNRSVVSSVGDDGYSSLRYFLNRAPAGGTVYFDPVLFSSPRVITLSTGELTIRAAVSVVGPGPGLLTIDGAGTSRLFNIHQKSSDTTHFSGLTLTNGRASDGGAISLTSGRLNLTDMVFKGNSATGTGGAVWATGDWAWVSITRGDFENNAADRGGAIGATGYVNASLSSFVKNVAYGAGGGAVWCASSGASCVQSAFVSNAALAGRGGAVMGNYANFEGCTFAANFALIGGAAALESTGSFTSCTLVQNNASSTGGAINVQSASILSSVFHDNRSPSARDIQSTSTITVTRSSLESVDGIAVGSDFQKNRPIGENPNLGTLGYYGGRTMTVPLLPGSPCIDRGPRTTSYSTDQRGVGFPRRVGPATDIGAYEGITAGNPVGDAPDTITVSGYSDVNAVVTVNYYFLGTFYLSTFDTHDIDIVSPDGAISFPVAVKATSPGAGEASVQYSIAPPHGVWTAADNGVYAFRIRPNQVFDNAGRSALSDDVGSFRVSVPQAIVVDTTADSGPGSLRAAIIRINDAHYGQTPILFSPAVFSTPRTILLTSGPLIVTSALTIAGPGADLLTIDAGGSSRIFEWRQPRNAISYLWGITATHGQTADAGGAMFVDSGLRVSNSRFVDNRSDMGGAIFVAPQSSLTITTSTLSGNRARTSGGAIFGDAYPGSNIAVESCEIRDNFSNTGGGITSLGYLTLTRSTLSGNTATGGDGGGIYSVAWGGAGIRVYGSTISGNAAQGSGGGIAAIASNPLWIYSSTIVYNNAVTGTGGGILMTASQSLFVDSSIVSLNSAVAVPDVSSDYTFIVSKSLLGSTPTLKAIGALVLPIGTNPRLGPLADNGGPTRTHALLPDSPCINLGNNSQSLATDQRGLPRAVGSLPDIGAFEVQPVRVASVTINEGSAQRSRVTSLTVNFTGAVSLPAVPADAFRLVRQYDGAAVALQAKLAGNSAVLTFTSGPLEAGSLADGKYTLTVRGSQVLKGLLDGNGDGTPGD